MNAKKKSIINTLKKIDKLSDQDIDYSDIPEITPKMFAKAVIQKNLVTISPKDMLTLRVDHEVLQWYRKLGKGYQTLINEILKEYMHAHILKKASYK